MTISHPLFQRKKAFDKHKHRISPWITKGIMKSIHRRDNLSKKIKNTPIDSPNHVLLCKNMKILKQSLRTLIREAKKIHYDSEFIKFSGDCKKNLE